MNLYYSALPVGQGCVPSLPLKYQVDNSCCSLTFFPQRCGACGYRRPLEKGETVYDTQQIGVGKAWTLQDCWEEWSPSLTCRASLKVISNYQGIKIHHNQTEWSQSFLQNPAGYQSTVSLPHAPQWDVFHVQSGGNILTSRQGFLSADCWCMLWKLLKHWPNVSGFHQFFLQ